MISVIIPTFRHSPTLACSRQQILACPMVKELIIVAHEQLRGQIRADGEREVLTFSARAGRGYQLLEGAKRASGEVLLFLHDDTLLPPQWDKCIMEAMREERVAGGAFSLTFNTHHWFLTLLIRLSGLLFLLTGELWGDRGLFIRKKLLEGQDDILDVPIMEDVRLSHFMKRKGKTVLLKAAVMTDAGTFLEKGLLRHTLTIIACRLLYSLGASPRKIYRLYYT